LTFFFRILPASGPFSALKIRTPTPEVEKLFMASFNATVDRYKAMLANVETGGPDPPNENFDLGVPSKAGKYKGADEAFAKLVGRLAEKQYAGMSAELRQNILDFYQGSDPSVSATRLTEQLDRLKAVRKASRNSGSP
jgi:hypothetical protein